MADPIEEALAWAEGPERPVGETPKDIHARNLAAAYRESRLEVEALKNERDEWRTKARIGR